MPSNGSFEIQPSLRHMNHVSEREWCVSTSKSFEYENLNAVESKACRADSQGVRGLECG
jgi:hypothetical protein